jgi:imidazolonepropionase-like amidohydrolase
VSDRYEQGIPAVLLKNATIWTGRESGKEVIHGDLLLDKGLIKAVGDIVLRNEHGINEVKVVDLHGAWVTPGILDMHSHLGVDSLPELSGSDDTNSVKGIAQPWLRSLDGLNTHDDAYHLSISGGVSTAIVLPGSANAIGGQAFAIKLRPTKSRSVSSMLLDPPYNSDTMRADPYAPPRWRQMKHACGENPSNVYSGTRMDTMWSFRQAYDTARKIKQQQDAYCRRAFAGDWDDLGEFPEDLQWEALVDVLRGRVKVHTHCYEVTDLEGIIRLTNEFNFSIAAFHHAHETYLVPDLLKKAFGHPPAVALFATNARYKREAYRGSEFAARILADNGLQVVMKSDHPVQNSRHLLFEAQQAFYYGLAENLALASVTSTPAIVSGLDYRVGFVKAGYDADIVVWDSHPLALGATPAQVYIDGISQIKNPISIHKPSTFQVLPRTPNYDEERAKTLKYDGLPPLEPTCPDFEAVLFTNVSSVYVKNAYSVSSAFMATTSADYMTVLAHRGKIQLCGNDLLGCASAKVAGARQIDLQGGSISPALVTYGSPLGLEHIEAEPSTRDGNIKDALTSDLPEIAGGSGTVIRAVDGLQFSTRDALLAYRTGVASGIVAPVASGMLSGLSTFFDTGAPHRLSKSAVLQETAAFHVSIGTSDTSISTQIATLRHLLLGGGKGALAAQFQRILEGKLPLVVDVHSADIMASVIQLKAEVEAYTGSELRLVFSGAAEAHLIAKEISQANVGVILNPSRPFPINWRARRILPGPPLSEKNALSALLANNVTVGFGVQEKWMARNLRLDIAWAAIEVFGEISEAQALAIGSANLEKMLGVEEVNSDLVATQAGSLLDASSRVVAIISSRKEIVDVL